MKKSAITPEVIKLSKEIAELWKCLVGEGSWILPDKGFSWVEPLDADMPHLVINKSTPPNSYLELKNYKGHHSLPYTPGYFIPIPSISDSEQRLNELGCFVTKLDRIFEMIIKGKSIHEALLSALLEVLKSASK